MKQNIIIASFLLLLVSCNQQQSSDDIKTEVVQETFQTYPELVKDSLLIKLKNDLKTEKFAIEKVVKENSYTEYDGNRNVNVVVKGEGITKYTIKRQEAKPAGYYPDFNMYVFELKNETLAKDCFAKLTFARFSPGSGEKRMKDVLVMTQNGNKVFILFTRAEMFRSYITHFIHRINKY